MRTNATLARRLNELAELVESTVSETVLNLVAASSPFEAEQLREDGKNFVFALHDAIGVLTPKGGAV